MRNEKMVIWSVMTLRQASWRTDPVALDDKKDQCRVIA
jgi:hypothetical protein